MSIIERMQAPFNKTKIVATLGPSSNTLEMIRKLAFSGVDVFRLNSSHGSVADHEQAVSFIRQIAKEEDIALAILLDLQGPKIRLGIFEGVRVAKVGDTLDLSVSSDKESALFVDYKGLTKDVHVGDPIMINDGRIRLRVMDVVGDIVHTVVEAGGELSSRKGVNLPGTDVAVDAMTTKDRDYVAWGVKQDVDFIALSFVRKAKDIIDLKQLLKECGKAIPVIAKIEKPQAIDRLDEIIEASDGVMVARGDLGVEMNPEQVPIIQKSIIQKANFAQKPVIVATQMLESMIHEPVATRAEVADVANAILDGTDAIMLSAETASGDFPVESVTMMSRIASEVESSKLYNSQYLFLSQDHRADLNTQITRLLDLLPIKAVIAITQTGRTAEKLSKAKVRHPIIALCPQIRMVRQLSLLWGVYPLLYKGPLEISEVTIHQVAEHVREHSFLKEGDQVMLVTGLPYFTLGKTTSFRLCSI